MLAATGLVDELPDIDGLAEHWGGDVIHCPFCHGFEVRDRRIVQIVTHPMGLHPAGLFRQLSARLTLVLHDGVDADDPELEALRAAGVNVVDGRVRRIVTGDDGHVAAVELTDGDRIDADAVVIGARFRVRAEPFASLGLEPAEHPTGLGDFVETDATGATAVPGLYAAGNVTDPSQQVLQAAADGSRVGAMISFSLAHDDIERRRPTVGQRGRLGPPLRRRPDVERQPERHARQRDRRPARRPRPRRRRRRGRRRGLAGRAGLERDRERHLAAGAGPRRRRGRATRAARSSATTPTPTRSTRSSAGAFDLVSAQYASIPRTPDGRGVRNLLDAVAPGGTLLVVSHDLEPMRAPIDTHGHSRPFDPDAYVRVDDFAAALADSPEWEIEVHEKRPRPPGAASASHHVDDVVLRARRRAG